MDLSFEGENNFPLPEPAGTLDFTEDEDQTNRNKNIESNAEQDTETMNVSMNEAEVNDEEEVNNEEINDDDESDEDTTGKQADQLNEMPEKFDKPIINQNLFLNKNKNNQTKNMIYNQNGLKEPVTPALIKRKQFKPWFNSPTDNCLSPCTQKIFKPKKPT